MLLVVYLGHNSATLNELNELKTGIFLGRHEETALYCEAVEQDYEEVLLKTIETFSRGMFPTNYKPQIVLFIRITCQSPIDI